MPLPSKTQPRSGRRLFVFPDIVRGGAPGAVTKSIVGTTRKALVLSQSTTVDAEAAAQALTPDGVPAFGKEVVEQGLESFATATTGVLGLANRYDGLDLPGDTCRIVVLDGKPDAVSLQEKFLSERAEANAALAERVRTRIVQGAGRATRGPNDYAVVVVVGSDITRYFSREDNQTALEPELQAEVQFGWNNSKGSDPEDILDNVRVFLDHGAEWKQSGEPLVAEYREEARKTEAPGAAALGESATHEVEAWMLAYREDWVAASQKLEDAARTVGRGGDATRGYRALLLYLAGIWLHLGARGEAHRAHSRELIRRASQASVRGTWIKEMKEPPGAEEVTLTTADSVAVNNITARLTGNLKPNKIKEGLTRMRGALAQDEAVAYEVALTELGNFLGAEASKPTGAGRCDSAWRWNSALWMTLEAKTEEHPDGLLPLKDIRQANTQLDQLAADQGVEHAPGESPTIIISNRLTVGREHAAVANPNVYLASTEVISHIAGDAESVWTELLAAAARQAPVHILRRHVQATLADSGCLPTQLVERLTQERIRPGD